MSDNKVNVLKSSVAYNITAQGTYYLEVRGTGQGDPAATGYSNYGSVGNFRLTATYAQPVGTPPKAVMLTSATNGPAPLGVTFDGRASTDESRVAFWYWDFGDGSNEVSGSLASLTHVYQVAGAYLARLTVVDDSGLSSGTTQMINVQTPPPSASVQSIQITSKTNSDGYAWAVTALTVTNQLGKVLSGVKVTAKLERHRQQGGHRHHQYGRQGDLHFAQDQVPRLLQFHRDQHGEGRIPFQPDRQPHRPDLPVTVRSPAPLRRKLAEHDAFERHVRSGTRLAWPRNSTAGRTCLVSNS